MRENSIVQFEMTKTNVQKIHAVSKKRNLSLNRNKFSLGS